MFLSDDSSHQLELRLDDDVDVDDDDVDNDSDDLKEEEDAGEEVLGTTEESEAEADMDEVSQGEIDAVFVPTGEVTEAGLVARTLDTLDWPRITEVRRYRTS
jgi:hypothetical protein